MEELNRKIMLVDDDRTSWNRSEWFLKATTTTVETASSEEGAVKLMETFKPDLAIFDLMMNNYDSGFILAHKLKKLYPEALVIIATGVTKETGFRFASDSQYGGNWTNADLIMDKGIRPDQILKEIKKLFKE